MGQLVRSLMVGKRARELFKTLKQVQVTVNPFDEKATTAREFVRRVRTPPVKKANPKLEVDVKIVEEIGSPTIQLTYVDGQEERIATSGMKIADIMDEVERVARWKGGDVVNPFENLRAARSRALGLE